MILHLLSAIAGPFASLNSIAEIAILVGVGCTFLVAMPELILRSVLAGDVPFVVETLDGLSDENVVD